MYNNTFLLLNGTPESANKLQGADYIVCADGAYNWARKLCKPNAIVGDMDSVQGLPSDLIVERYSKDKDYTDGHLAMQHLLKMHPTKITILGARGGRADMEFFNYFLLCYCTEQLQIVMDAGTQWIELANGNFKRKVDKNSKVSLSPFNGSVHIKYSKGLKYCLDDTEYFANGIAPVSNIALQNSFEIQVAKGMALVFYSKLQNL